MVDVNALREDAEVLVRARVLRFATTHKDQRAASLHIAVGDCDAWIDVDAIASIASQPFQPGDQVRLDGETIGTLISFSAHDHSMAFFEAGTTEGGIQHVAINRLRHENPEKPQG